MTAPMERHRTPTRGPVTWLRGVATRPRVGLAVVAAVIAVVVGASVWGSVRTVDAERESAVRGQQLDTIADPLAALCAADPTVRARLGDEVCFTAQQVVDTPPQQPVPGPDGRPGINGRGITATVIRADGHLVVSYSDGARIDVGPVVGQSGTPGRGIRAAQIAAGRLELVFTDGAVQDLGPVVGDAGAAGRGIESTAIADGRLIVTYTDGTTQDAGPVPEGPRGEPGQDAELPERYTNVYPDGTSETCTRSGGDDSAPVYDCTDRGVVEG